MQPIIVFGPIPLLAKIVIAAVVLVGLFLFVRGYIRDRRR